MIAVPLRYHLVQYRLQSLLQYLMPSSGPACTCTSGCTAIQMPGKAALRFGAALLVGLLCGRLAGVRLDCDGAAADDLLPALAVHYTCKIGPRCDLVSLQDGSSGLRALKEWRQGR